MVFGQFDPRIHSDYANSDNAEFTAQSTSDITDTGISDIFWGSDGQISLKSFLSDESLSPE